MTNEWNINRRLRGKGGWQGAEVRENKWQAKGSRYTQTAFKENDDRSRPKQTLQNDNAELANFKLSKFPTWTPFNDRPLKCVRYPVILINIGLSNFHLTKCNRHWYYKLMFDNWHKTKPHLPESWGRFFKISELRHNLFTAVKRTSLELWRSSDGALTELKILKNRPLLSHMMYVWYRENRKNFGKKEPASGFSGRLCTFM
jgi:hypothetical protein